MINSKKYSRNNVLPIFVSLLVLCLVILFWSSNRTSYFLKSSKPINRSIASQYNRTEPLDKAKLFSFVHISKCAGSSWIKELQNYLSKNQVFPKSLAGAEFSVYAQNRMIQSEHYNLISLKSPRHHVFSLFMECKHDKWGYNVTNGTGFPRSGLSRADDEHDFQAWLNHFVRTESSGGKLSLSFGEIEDYHCYHPANYQSRALTSKTSKPHHMDFAIQNRKPIFEPNATDAIQTYWDHNWVAISDFYSESKCLLLYRISKGPTHTSTDPMAQEYLDLKCTCPDDYKVSSSSSSVKVENVKVLHHNGTRRSKLSDLPPDMLSKIEMLTRVDMKVYKVALLQFLREIAWLESENELGRRVLCQSSLDKLEDELSYLDLNITEEYNNAIKNTDGLDIIN